MKQVITATKTLLAAVEHNDGDNFTNVIRLRWRQRTVDTQDESPSEVSPSTHNHSTGRASPDVATRSRPSQAASNSSQAPYASIAARPPVSRKFTTGIHHWHIIGAWFGAKTNAAGYRRFHICIQGTGNTCNTTANPWHTKKRLPTGHYHPTMWGKWRRKRSSSSTSGATTPLIREVKRCCPGAKVVINKIPPRGRNEQLMNIISMINTFTSNITRDKRHRVHCNDTCPTSFRFYQRDEIHLNNEGKKLYANAMYRVISNLTKVLLKQKR